ncbi:MAG: hydrogenase nickel incorporation protein HypB [Ruminiclostridium sp.]|nr:hydrogenase nickel incorporation protein HypB [Ruminiclostridium sp.]
MEIKVMKNIMYANEKTANENREFFKQNHITAFNIMASPGAGKTSVILKIIEALKDIAGIGVIEGDIASSIDAEKIEKTGVPVVQINTSGGCHLDANMIKLAVRDLKLRENSLLFIENVGNLVCPSAFDLGESIKMVIASVPEGHDKPHKYISMFEAADIVVLNKTDLLPYIDFDKDSFYKGICLLNDNVPVFEISCRTQDGIKALLNWIGDKMFK